MVFSTYLALLLSIVAVASEDPPSTPLVPPLGSFTVYGDQVSGPFVCRLLAVRERGFFRRRAVRVLDVGGRAR